MDDGDNIELCDMLDNVLSSKVKTKRKKGKIVISNTENITTVPDSQEFTYSGYLKSDSILDGKSLSETCKSQNNKSRNIKSLVTLSESENELFSDADESPHTNDRCIESDMNANHSSEKKTKMKVESKILSVVSDEDDHVSKFEQVQVSQLEGKHYSSSDALKSKGEPLEKEMADVQELSMMLDSILISKTKKTSKKKKKESKVWNVADFNVKESVLDHESNVANTSSSSISSSSSCASYKSFLSSNATDEELLNSMLGPPKGKKQKLKIKKKDKAMGKFVLETVFSDEEVETVPHNSLLKDCIKPKAKYISKKAKHVLQTVISDDEETDDDLKNVSAFNNSNSSKSNDIEKRNKKINNILETVVTDEEGSDDTLRNLVKTDNNNSNGITNYLDIDEEETFEKSENDQSKINKTFSTFIMDSCTDSESDNINDVANSLVEAASPVDTNEVSIQASVKSDTSYSSNTSHDTSVDCSIRKSNVSMQNTSIQVSVKSQNSTSNIFVSSDEGEHDVSDTFDVSVDPVKESNGKLDHSFPGETELTVNHDPSASVQISDNQTAKEEIILTGKATLLQELDNSMLSIKTINNSSRDDSDIDSIKDLNSSKISVDNKSVQFSASPAGFDSSVVSELDISEAKSCSSIENSIMYRTALDVLPEDEPSRVLMGKKSSLSINRRPNSLLAVIDEPRHEEGGEQTKVQSISRERYRDISPSSSSESDRFENFLDKVQKPAIQKQANQRDITSRYRDNSPSSSSSSESDGFENFLDKVQKPAIQKQANQRDKTSSDDSFIVSDNADDSFIASDNDSLEEDGAFYITANKEAFQNLSDQLVLTSDDDFETVTQSVSNELEEKENLNHQLVLTSDDEFETITPSATPSGPYQQRKNVLIMSDDSEEEFELTFKTPKPKPATPTALGFKTPSHRPPPLIDHGHSVPANKRRPLALRQDHVVPATTGHKPLAGFLESLSDNIPEIRRSGEASRYIKNFKKTKEELTQRLYRLYNDTIFEKKLPSDLHILWNTRLLKTAGYCAYKRLKGVNEVRTARIELSVKVCDSAERLRDTLIHELCHAAVWLLHGANDGHGPYWKIYAKKANRIHPELPIIMRCHNYEINCKFIYKCTKCTYEIGRHSKSLDITKKCCGICSSPFQLLVNTKKGVQTPATPSTPRTLNKFAMFVKENFGKVKSSQKGASHKEVMQQLSKDFAAKNKVS